MATKYYSKELHNAALFSRQKGGVVLAITRNFYVQNKEKIIKDCFESHIIFTYDILQNADKTQAPFTMRSTMIYHRFRGVRRSINYNNVRKGIIIGSTKRKKIRTVDFTTTLAEILKAAKKQQEQNRFTYGELYC